MIKNAPILGCLAALIWAGCGQVSAADGKKPSSFGATSLGQTASLVEPFQGIVEYEERVLGFEVGGRVVEARVDSGDEVKAGAVLLRLDDGLERANRAGRVAETHLAQAQLRLLQNGARPAEKRRAQAELAASKATEALLRRTLERQTRLASSGAAPTATVDDLQGQLDGAIAKRTALEEQTQLVLTGSRAEEVEAAKARLEAAEAAVALIDTRLARYSIQSDIDASVIDVMVENNEVVSAGAPVISLADIHHPYVDVFVPQAQMAAMRVGLRASVRVDALSTTLAGHVEHVGRRTEFTPRFLFSERERPNLVIRVRVRVEDPNASLRAGVPAFVSLVTHDTAAKP